MSPAVDEVRDRVVYTEGGRVQVPADLHVVTSHDANCSFVLVFKDLPLKRGAQQQHEVIYGKKKPQIYLVFNFQNNI